MAKKPKAPFPLLARRILRKALPRKIYRTYVGRHEDKSMALWETLSQKVESGKAVLDIGAFHGIFSLITRKVNATVEIYAFEPSPQNLRTLKENIRGKSIHLECLAMAETSGQVSFHLQQAMSHIAIQSEGETDIPQNDQVVSVKAVTLDDWVTENGVSPGLIKLDTEGMEALILKSGQQTLAQHKPIIHCEVLSDDAGIEVMNQLPTDYLFFHIDENKGISLRKVINRKKWRNHNWLLAPESKKAFVDRFCG